MTTHKDLIVWQKAMQLVLLVYRYTKSFPKEEMYGITGQMRRASVSIPSNIAEGYGRSSNKELIHFLDIAMGSSSELETQIIISYKLQFLQEPEYNELSSLNDEVMKMLASLIRNKKSKLNT
ncbi:MAG: four helix bundle protein [Bacteroidetes bacterium]|nr:four helix bundle protein [Bacteroidota bacterium]